MSEDQKSHTDEADLNECAETYQACMAARRERLQKSVAQNPGASIAELAQIAGVATTTIERFRKRNRKHPSPDGCQPLSKNGNGHNVSYNNQPGIAASGGAVPLAGNSHVYTVRKLLWPEEVEGLLGVLLIGRSLHVCCGHSRLGDVRFDNDPAVEPDITGDAADLPFADGSFDTVLCDPPYNGEFQWNHSLLAGLSRVAAQRIVFQHWFIPADPDGRWKKWHKFHLTELYVWQPRTYFGRAQLISVFDA